MVLPRRCPDQQNTKLPEHTDDAACLYAHTKTIQSDRPMIMAIRYGQNLIFAPNLPSTASFEKIYPDVSIPYRLAAW